MSDRPRVLVTGPIKGLDDYTNAADEAGWDGLAFPLVSIAPTDLELVDSIDGLPGYVAVTSANALPALERAIRSLPELLTVPLAAVGTRTAEAARSLGFKVSIDETLDGRSLAAALVEHCPPGTKVLWPRGDLARDFGEALTSGGLVVVDPVVYATVAVEQDEPPPATEAVFFASPSAVAAWSSDSDWPTPARAIAIGATTLEALATSPTWSGIPRTALEKPEPGAFVQTLTEWQSEST